MGLGPLVDNAAVGALALRLAFDLAFVAIAVELVYVRLHQRREHVLTYFVFNIVTLCLCVLLRKSPAELGFALTLFGVFGILRYRTEQIRSRDLTYLFLVIGLGITNGVAGKEVSLAELLMANAVIVMVTAVLEYWTSRQASYAVPLLYDRLELLRPGSETALLADIKARTGLEPLRVDTERVDLLRDAVELTIYCRRGGR